MNVGTRGNQDEPLLSFGDDTIAAINQLEISRIIYDYTQKDVRVSSTYNISPRRAVQLLGSSFVPSPKQTNHCQNSSLALDSASGNISAQLCTQEKCDLTAWGLPASVLKEYHSKGIKSMFQWQVECISDAEVLEGKNLVYSAPTSAGKTLVAEILTLKTVLEKKKKAIVILPFVSVVREKMFYFQELLETSGVRVQGLMGSHSLQGGFKNVDIAICTIEKANGLINRLLEEDTLHLVGIVVIDELHLLGDPFRGYLLELLITKIRYMNLVKQDINVQLVGMSATLPNLDLLASWLDARLYKTAFRPIPLNEYLKVGNTIYNKNLQVERTLEAKFDIQDDSDNVVQLCLETIFNGHSCLIFCPTKNWCEKLAVSVAKELYNLGKGDSEMGIELRKQLNSSAISEALGQLKACPVGLEAALAKSISFGVAFHHAGLTIDERDIIEGLFRSGVVRVLVATSTLSSGVNLPARRVIIRTPVFHRRPLDVQVYQQMVGRAGRMGKDTEGESILLCGNTEKKVGEQLIRETLNPISSCLGHGELSSSLKRALLEVIASGVVETPEEVKCYTNCTLLAASHEGLENPIESCITFLMENECIRLQLCDDGSKKYVPTPLGHACLSASMSPDDGLELFQELQKARQCFVLENELHLIYLVTPFSVSAQWSNLDWLQIMNLWEKLPSSMKRVGNLVGIDESFMVRALRGTVNLNNHKQFHKLSIHRRFHTALALQELVNETPLVEVASKFQCSKGMLQSLQQTSSTFAGMVTAFCRRLGWRNLELLVSQFQERLQFGVHRELCELMRLDILNGPRARALFNAGITCLGDLASADVCEVENALHKSVTFQTSKEMCGETAFDTAYRNKLKTIWITGRQGLTEREAAELLIKEAQHWLEQEFGLADVRWGKKQDETSEPSDSPSIVNVDDSCYSELKNEAETVHSIDENSAVSEQECDENKNESALQDVSSKSKSEIIEESQALDDESENEIFDAEGDVSSPVSDIFEEALDNETSEIGCSGNISLSSGKINSSAVNVTNSICFDSSANTDSKIIDNPKINNTALKFQNVTSIENNGKTAYSASELESSGNSDGVQDIVQSRYSVDMFDSPVQAPVSGSCSTPNLFEDSLVVDSHLGKMLDLSGNKSSVELAKSHALDSKAELENLSQSVLVCECKTFKLPLMCETTPKGEKKLINSDTSLNSLLEKSLDCFSSSNFDMLCEKSNLGFKSLSKCNPAVCEVNVSNLGREQLCKMPTILKETELIHSRCSENQTIGRLKITNVTNKEQIKAPNNVHLSVYDEALTDTFLRQAFTTVCEFDNTGNKSVILKESVSTIEQSKVNCSPKKSHESLFIVPPVENLDSKITVNTYSKISKRKMNDSEIFDNVTKRSVLKERTFSVSEVGSYLGCKDSIVNDSDEAEDDLVPSSQSQSDATSCVSVQSCQKKKKKPTKKKLPEAKRLKLEQKIFVTESPMKIGLETKLERDTSWEYFQIIDLCNERRKFEQFKADLLNYSHISFSLACEYFVKQSPKRSIGDRVIGKKLKKEEISSKQLICEKYLIVGLAICVGEKSAFYLFLDPSNKGAGSQTVSFSEQLDLIERIMSHEGTYFLSAYDFKEQYKVLHKSCSVTTEKEIADPKVAEWMVDPENDEKNIQALMSKYIPSSKALFKRVGNVSHPSSLGLHTRSHVHPRIRSCVEAIATWHLISAQITLLKEKNIFKIFKEIEMPTILCLAHMEVNGIGFSKVEAEKLHLTLQKQLTVLEREAYKLAGHSFSLSSRNDVSKVLFKELGLKSSKLTSTHKLSTNKDVLIKLKNDHPIPAVILEWRKIHFIMSKVLLQFLSVGVSDRIFGYYATDTVTGRIHMHSPNLQSIPRNFEINYNGEEKTVSMRQAFVPKPGKSLVSADYSQLELRLLAHLSQDKVLIGILKSDQDVFKSVAASWNKIPLSKVTDNLRQRAKQVCYGVIYGIGASALSDQLEVDEEEATLFMETFMNAYPGLKEFRKEVIKQCNERGYVETLFGRKRFLPSIKSSKQHIRAQAERQAVNTTVQGSAADVAKTGMVLVEASLKAAFLNDSTRIRRLRENKRQCIETSVATLVLHLHDELLYEVADEYVDDVIQIVKGSMEAAANLTVPLPVKVKCGKSWGSLVEVI